MKKIVILFAFIAFANAISIYDLMQEEWTQFKLEHAKSYNSDIEDRFRMKIFMENRLKIAKHNQLYEKDEVTFKMSMNKFGDLLHHEFVNRMNGFNRTGAPNVNDSQREDPITYIEPANIELPTSIDWRKKGAVTGIKDQGQCGSCWAFSATGSLEGQHFRKSGVLVSLSEQNLVDCSGKYGNEGCDGGLMDQAFKYIKDNGGIDTEKSYPYDAKDEKCHYNPKDSGATDRGFVDIPKGNENKLMAAIATIGPISVAIDASHDSFQFYSHGIYNEPNCDPNDLDHGVLAVGYGTDAKGNEKGKDYYIVKNSWGMDWGEKGYIRMSRNYKNQCGIASSASYPLV